MKAADDQPASRQQEGNCAGGTASSNDGSGAGAGGLLLIAGLTLVWDCNWPFIKIALSEAPI